MTTPTATGMAAQVVAALWAKVLGVGHLGVDDDLAALGADSLDAARVVARIRQACGVEPPFRTVFEARTPRALADALNRQAAPGRQVAPDGQAAPPGQVAPDGQLVPDGQAAPPGGAPPAAALWPLSHDQQRLWLLDQNGEAGTAAYHLPVVLQLIGELDRAALERALTDVVARHGSLRTRFVVEGHQPMQQVLPPGRCELPVIDAAGADVLRRVAELAAPGFDLAAAAPWRAALYRLADQDHVLAMVIHHIVFDGWSEEILRRELAELYAAHRDRRPPRLPELAFQYADHARWQHELGERGWAGQLAYWGRQLAGVTPLDLPSDRPRPAEWTGDGAGHTFILDARLAAAVRALARRHRATPFMALLAAWTALLGRLCDTTDVVVGASTAERGRPELEDLIGMFVNVLVIRPGLAGRRSFTDLLAAVRETTLDAFAHRDVPFGRLVAELAPDRDASRNPLFNVNFVYLNMPIAAEQWPGLRVRQLQPPARSTAFDLILAVQDQPDGTLRCYLEYSTAMFDPPTIERIGRWYRQLLDGFVADPDAPLGSVSPLTEQERRELLVDVNATTAPLPDECVHTVVQRQAQRTPAAVAVVCGGRTLSYGELDARANQLAHHLRLHGVGPETAVAIRLPRGVEQVVAMLAVWKAGGYYVAIDDEHPADRIAAMLADAAALVVITRGAGRIAESERAGVAKAVCLDRDGPHLRTLPAVAPPGLDPPPDTTAAAIYTSGSTGTPKAVALSHRNVLAAQVGRDAYQAPPRCLLLPVSFAFDVFLSFAVWTLRAGGRLVIPVLSRGTDLDELAALLHTERVTHLCATPDTQRALLARDDVRAANHLTLGIVGGQSCPRVVVDDYARWAPGSRVVNEYGLTETSYGTYHLTGFPTGTAGAGGTVPVGAAGVSGTVPVGAAGTLPIGRPASNCRVYLLDVNLEPVPVGVPAELYLGGPGIARGYVGRPELTADRFVPDPFGGPGERLYRTGDLGRFRADGTIEFLGRRDRQVKVRGMRIELAEIEAALARHPGVAAAAVGHLAERQALVAYVVGRNGNTPGDRELRAHLRRLLPEPMVPSAFVALEEMPLTPTGKIDRAALARLDTEPAAPAERTPPRTPAEHAVAEVWADVLEAADIDVHADFFQLGGHSLLAANVVSRLRAVFPVPLNLGDLFGSPTVAGLAELIGTRMLDAVRSQFGEQITEQRTGQDPGQVPGQVPGRATGQVTGQVTGRPAGDVAGRPRAAAAGTAVPADEPIVAVELSGPAPLSAGQRQLWLVDRIQSGSAAYQIPLALRLTGVLDTGALRSALDAVVARHEVLRTRIELVDDEPVQRVDPPRAVDLPLIETPHDRLTTVLDGLVARPFDLTADLMVRAALVRLNAEEHVLLLVLHHIATDGESVRILTGELAELYSAEVERRAPRLAELPIRYTDYAGWYGRRAASDEYRAQLDYWRRQLDGVVPLRLPADRPAPARPDPSGRRVEFHLGRDLAAGVRALAGRHGATPFMVLLAAFKSLLVRIGAGTDIAVGTPVSGRGRVELAGLVGYFGNTIVLRTALAEELAFGEVLDRVRRVAAEGLARQQVAFASVVELVAPERNLSGAPLFNVMFAYENEPTTLPAIDGLATTELHLPIRTAQFDLTLRLFEQADGSVAGHLDYATALFEGRTADSLCQRYLRLLRTVLDNPDAAIGSVQLVDQTDSRALTRWNDTGREYRLAPLGRLLADQAARTPDAPALWAGGHWASYADFAGTVNRLARHLLRALEPEAPPEAARRWAGPKAPKAANVTFAASNEPNVTFAALGDRVIGVCLPRGEAMVTAVHAVVTAGAAYLPLPPDLPAARIAMMIEDARPAAVITTAELAHKIDDAGVRVVCLDGVDCGTAAAIAAEPITAPQVDVPLDALAYVIFTSGSTGRPKGVGVSHRAIVNRLLWMQETFPLDGSDRVLHKTPFSFDVSVWELFWPLLTGAGMVVADEGGHRDFGHLADLATATEVTTAHFVPSILAMFLDELQPAVPGAAGPTLAERLRSMRQVFCSGEALSADLAARVRAALPHVDLHNLYGPTEAAVDVSWHPCGGADDPVPIGRPVANTRLEVLDRNGERVPVGVPGELCIGGVQLARGYVGQPALTAERFVPDPFGGPGGRLYRTGDLARWRWDGTIDYLGRLDHQVKIRGVRIEPGEIEAALRAHPALTGAVVRVWEPTPGNARLVAYVTARPGPQPAADELRGHLRDRLPAAMVPAQFIVLPSFPLTPSGKLDRNALPEPDPSGIASGHVAPRNATEAAIARTWAGVLGVDRVGVFDDFFELGGNSIRAVQLAGRLASAGFGGSVQEVFLHRTVAALAGSRRGDPAGPLVWFRRGTDPADPPLVGDAADPLLVCVHPGDGSAHWYAALAEAIGGSLAAFEWPGIRGRAAPTEHAGSVEQIAGRYLTALRTARPRGPYRLLGWCGGAAIAWELAGQLEATGERVELFLLDPVVDVAARANFHEQLADFQRCEALFTSLATGDGEAAASARAEIVQILRTAIDDPEVSVTDDDVNAEWRGRLRAWRELLVANLDYTFRPYRGAVRLLVGEELRSAGHLVMHGLDYPRYLARWRELAAGGLQVSEVAGDHLGVLRRPNVGALARLLAGTGNGVRREAVERMEVGA